jgi:hypothetical protein
MTTITLPAQFKLASLQMSAQVNQRASAAPFGGSEQVVDMLNDRWLCSLALTPKTYAEAAEIEAFIAALRGQVNTCNLWHFRRPEPRGTVRGALTLNTAAAQGAAGIVVTGCTPGTGTLLAGDLLGVGGLLLMVASDCTAVAGVITVPLANRLRAAQNAGATVTWSAPTVPMRMLSNSGVVFADGFAAPTSFDFAEAI